MAKHVALDTWRQLHLLLDPVQPRAQAGCKRQVRVHGRVRAAKFDPGSFPLGDGMRIRELRLEVGDHAI